jgi:succinyl-diaminopimelate desuccinylase
MLSRLESLASKLIAFHSVAHDPSAIRSCVEWVCEHVRKHAPQLHFQRFQSGGKPSVLFTSGDTPPRVLLCGHLDVVEASRADAFTPRRDSAGRGAHLLGRGAADMKGPVAALLDVIEVEPPAGLGLLLTTDEESGGSHGAGYLLGTGDWRPDVVILPDGGANFHLVTEQKGVLRLHLVAQGQAAHGSRPWQGINAVERLYQGYQALLRAYPQPTAEEDWRVSIALTELHTVGNAPNSVPDRVEATLDVRFPGTLPDDGRGLVQEIEHILAAYDTSTEVLVHAPAFLLDRDSPWVEQLQHVARQVRGEPLAYLREAGASDARYFAAKDVPVLLFQPECGQWHHPGEWVGLESLVTFRAICAEFVRKALG